MITIGDCLNNCSITEAALVLANKVAFDKSKGFARSWDNKTYWQYASNMGRRVAALDPRTYRFKPTLRKERNVKWKKRILYLSTWEDKIVETWLSRALNKLLSKWFSRHSYAYRLDKLGIDTCQQHVVEALRASRYVVKRDISSFFYTIDHDILLAKLSALVDEDLLRLLAQRVQFSYYSEGELNEARVGVPFGSAIACLFANIYLTATDKKLAAGPARYFRYADDFLLAGRDPGAVLGQAALLADEIASLKLELHPDKAYNLSFDAHPAFECVNRFKYLGLEYSVEGVVRLPIEKRRKICNIFRRALAVHRRKIRRLDTLDAKLRLAVSCVGEAVLERIRQAAIIDYYLKHVDDEKQLRMMDREIAEMVISTVLDKPFRARDFRTVPYGRLREYGLPSLLHRSRLHRHGHLRVPFLSLYNGILIERYEEGRRRRLERISQIRLARKLERSSG